MLKKLKLHNDLTDGVQNYLSSPGLIYLNIVNKELN